MYFYKWNNFDNLLPEMQLKLFVKKISNSIFGIGLNDEKSLLKSIYNQYKVHYNV